MKDLIGKKFKRNVYGLTEWTDTVTNVFIVRSFISKGIWKPLIGIKGTRGIWSYDLDEIVFID